MHIPDFLLDSRVAAATGAAGAAGLFFCLRKLERQVGERTTVLMGTMAAFVFAAQMVNFPVGPRVSGHLLGGVLVSVLLGPWAAAVVIAAVLLVQCFLFADGGVTALGANFVNMGLIGAVGGYAVYAPIRRAISGQKGILIGAMAAAWFSVLLASGAFAVELAVFRRRGDFFQILSWMALVHAAIGVGEALITGVVVRFLLVRRPDLFDDLSGLPVRPSAAGRWGQYHARRPGHRLGGGSVCPALARGLMTSRMEAPSSASARNSASWRPIQPHRLYRFPRRSPTMN